jgi:hypothetical protein
VQRRSIRMTLLTRCLYGSGSFAFPAPRSSLPVARLDLRGFPSNHRLLLTPLRSLAGARPSWASLLSRTRGHFCRPRSIGPGRFVFRPPLLRFVRIFPDSLSSTSSPASAFPWCCHHFGLEQQARIAFRPCRFARLRRVSPPIARVFTGLFITVQGDEGLAGLLRPAANRRVRCVSSASSGGANPRSGIGFRPFSWPKPEAFLAGHSDSRFPASKFVPPGGFPPPAAVPRLRGRCLLGLFVVFDPRPSQ